MVRPIHTDFFFHQGRGPELQRIFWSKSATVIRAISYFNPDDIHEPASLKHIRFEKPQVVKITPEEVIGSHDVVDPRGHHCPAAMFILEGANGFLP